MSSSKPIPASNNTVFVSVNEDDFDVNQLLLAQRSGRFDVGAQVVFVGLVRDFLSSSSMSHNEQSKAQSCMELEHYPEMTERILREIGERVSQHWKLHALTVIHRVGKLRLGEQIVAVVAASRHRGDAFAACECMMDYLKTQAPFWKKEIQGTDGVWVDARASDEHALSKWETIFSKGVATNVPSENREGNYE